MKIELNKSKFLAGLQLVQNVVSTRTTLPILSNVLIRAADASVQLTSTDLDVSVRCSVAAKVTKAGACTLPVRKLASVVRELPEAPLQLEADAKNLVTLLCGGSFFRINGLPAEEFPAQPKLEKTKQISLPQAALKEILRLTTYAISTDESRFVLNGLLLSFKGEKVTAVATDGRRLALVEKEMEIAKENEQEVIVPNKAIAELGRLLADDGLVEIKLTENQVAVEFIRPKAEKKGENTATGAAQEASNEGVQLLTKQIVGNFPNYRQVIPSETKERVTLEREAFAQAILRASLLTTEKSSAVKLAFSKNQLTISANAPEVGEAKETLAVNYRGKEMAIAFNPAFLLDPLRNLDTDEVILELTDELSPGVLKINAPFLYVVMPLRLS